MAALPSRKIILLALTCLMAAGCIKGPLWRTGYASPWARQRWAEEERIAQTIYSRRDDLAAIVQAANRGSAQDRERAAEQLAQIAATDSVLLVRQEAVKLLGELDAVAARAALRSAAHDPLSEIRMAAVFACSQPVHPEKAMILQEVIGSDADIDVRLAATRALQHFDGQEALGALAIALDDPNPALQLRAAESLQVVTGEKHGSNIRAWQEYVRRSTRPDAASESAQTADSTASSPGLVR